MFWSRLDDAKQEVDSGHTPMVSLSSKPSPKNKLKSITEIVESESPVRSSIMEDVDEDEGLPILNKVSEYLFDLFDANCMEGYQKIDAFEKRALQSFQKYDEEEYTFEQEQLHREFMVLFEELIEDFLKEENISINELYKQLSDYIDYQDNKSGQNYILSNEIADVITFYTSFDIWANHMKDQCRYSLDHFKGFSDTIQDIHRDAQHLSKTSVSSNMAEKKEENDHYCSNRFNNEFSYSDEKHSFKSL